MKCQYCGAELNGIRCEYCDSKASGFGTLGELASMPGMNGNIKNSTQKTVYRKVVRTDKNGTVTEEYEEKSEDGIGSGIPDNMMDDIMERMSKNNSNGNNGKTTVTFKHSSTNPNGGSGLFGGLKNLFNK